MVSHPVSKVLGGQRQSRDLLSRTGSAQNDLRGKAFGGTVRANHESRSGNRSLRDSVVFSAWGVPISIRTNDAEIIPRLLDHLPPDAKPTSAAPKRLYTLLMATTNRSSDPAGPSGGAASLSETERPANANDTYELKAGGVTLLKTNDLTEVLEALESDVQLQIADMCEQGLFVHAGVVGWRGRAILIPGLSGSGKTTLVAALVKAGATYYSDEYAVLDQDGRVHPYARRLSIRVAHVSLRMRCRPDDLGGTRGVDPLSVGLIAVTRYRFGANWRPRLLSPGRAVLALIDNTVSIRRRPQSALATLRCAVSKALALESARGEASEMPELLFRQADDQRPSNWLT